MPSIHPAVQKQSRKKDGYKKNIPQGFCLLACFSHALPLAEKKTQLEKLPTPVAVSIVKKTNIAMLLLILQQRCRRYITLTAVADLQLKQQQQLATKYLDFFLSHHQQHSKKKRKADCRSPPTHRAASPNYYVRIGL